jgi:hypothetical protein
MALVLARMLRFCLQNETRSEIVVRTLAARIRRLHPAADNVPARPNSFRSSTSPWLISLDWAAAMAPGIPRLLRSLYGCTLRTRPSFRKHWLSASTQRLVRQQRYRQSRQHLIVLSACMFTPPKQESAWSALNKARVERLQAAGVLYPVGQSQAARTMRIHSIAQLTRF